MYLQPRCGVLATKESLLRLWCDLGARQPFIRRRATRAGTPTCEANHRFPTPGSFSLPGHHWLGIGLASPLALTYPPELRPCGLSSFQSYNGVSRPARVRACRIRAWLGRPLLSPASPCYASIFPKGPPTTFFLLDCGTAPLTTQNRCKGRPGRGRMRFRLALNPLYHYTLTAWRPPHHYMI